MQSQINHQILNSASVIDTMLLWSLNDLPLFNDEVYTRRKTPEELAIFLNNNRGSFFCINA
jgi:hypothetical protein